MDTKEAGKLGGTKTLQLKGVEHFKNISRLAQEARKRNREERLKNKLPLDK